MTDHDRRPLAVVLAAVSGFCSGAARAVIAWVFIHVLDRD